jgi:hypothetical protein
MLLMISTTHHPATDLVYILHKNPSRVQTEELAFGKARVFYPEANDDFCTAAVLLEVDPIALVRGRRGPVDETLERVCSPMNDPFALLCNDVPRGFLREERDFRKKVCELAE